MDLEWPELALGLLLQSVKKMMNERLEPQLVCGARSLKLSRVLISGPNRACGMKSHAERGCRPGTIPCADTGVL